MPFDDQETTRVRVSLPRDLADRLEAHYGNETTSASEIVRRAAADGLRWREHLEKSGEWGTCEARETTEHARCGCDE